MATLADLIRFRDDMRAARYSGARVFQDQNGERIEYRSDRELAAAMAALESEKRGTGGQAGQPHPSQNLKRTRPMKNFVQRGDTITVAAPATTAGGTVVTIGELVGIAAGDAATGEPLDVVTVGVFDLPKVGTDVIAVGDLVFADGDGLVTVEEDDGGTLTPVAFTPLGLAVTAAGSGVASVHVKIG